MKKIITVLLLACLSYLFAESYEELFTKAQEYENNKQYVHALGTYYDAIRLEKSEKAIPAMNQFYNLSQIIKTGKPGYGEFDEFDLYENWVMLLREYDSYVTENPPITIPIENIKRVNVNLENKTADYEINCSVNRFNQKSEILKNIIYTGCPKNITIYSMDEVIKNDYLINNVPLFELPYKQKEYQNAITDGWNIKWKGIVSNTDGLFSYEFIDKSIKSIKKEDMKFFEGDGIKSLTFTITEIQFEYGPMDIKRGEARPKYTCLNPKSILLKIGSYSDIYPERFPLGLCDFLQILNEHVHILHDLQKKLSVSIETSEYNRFSQRYVTSKHKLMDIYNGQNYFYNEESKAISYKLLKEFIDGIVRQYSSDAIINQKRIDYFLDEFKKVNKCFPENTIVKEYNLFFSSLPYNWNDLNYTGDYLITQKTKKKGNK